MNITAIERRWAREILDTIFPGNSEPRLRMGAADLDTDAFFQDVGRHFPALSVLGLRVAILIVTLAPIFLLRTLRTFRGINREQRLVVLDRLYNSRIYQVRALLTLIKAMGGLLYGGAPEVRRAILRGTATPAAQGKDANRGEGLVQIKTRREAVAQ